MDHMFGRAKCKTKADQGFKIAIYYSYSQYCPTMKMDKAMDQMLPNGSG